MAINDKLMGLGIAAGLGLSAAGSAYGQDVHKAAYAIPTTDGARYLGQEQKDIIPEIPGNETTIRWYETKQGTRFAAYFVKNKKGKERIYGFDVDTTGAPPWEYSLVDPLGNENFQVIQPGARFTISNGWIGKYINSTG